MDKFWDSAVAIGTAIIGVAIIAVLVSRNSQTPAVLQSAAAGFSNALDVAVSPVTGMGVSPNLSYGVSAALGGILPTSLLGNVNTQVLG